MGLLDATLSMALTLGALATIVTILMEIVFRAVRMRRSNLVEVMRLLNKELGERSPLGLTPDERWEFINSVIHNPANTSSENLDHRLDTQSLFEKLHEWIGNRTGNGDGTNESQSNKASPNATSTEGQNAGISQEKFNRRINKLGRVLTSDKPVWRRALLFLNLAVTLVPRMLQGDSRSLLYDKVTLEHVLRRLVEVEKVEHLSRTATVTIKSELNRVARKFEEFGSAVSATFKRNAQAWSVVVGTLFAFGANIDGFRIFEAYRNDVGLANAVIQQQPGLIGSFEDAVARQDALATAQERVDRILGEVSALRSEISAMDADGGQDAASAGEALKSKRQALAAKEQELAEAREAAATMTSVEDIRNSAERARQQLADLVNLGIPVGWHLYPNCPYGEDGLEWQNAGAKCRNLLASGRRAEPGAEASSTYSQDQRDDAWPTVLQTLRADTGGFLAWVLAVFVTGVLIGLGAPFWFDVAKRLAQIREGLRGTASGEVRMSGNDADGDPDKRKAIVDRVVNDVTIEGSGRRGARARRVADAEIRRRGI